MKAMAPMAGTARDAELCGTGTLPVPLLPVCCALACELETREPAPVCCCAPAPVASFNTELTRVFQPAGTVRPAAVAIDEYSATLAESMLSASNEE